MEHFEPRSEVTVWHAAAVDCARLRGLLVSGWAGHGEMASFGYLRNYTYNVDLPKVASNYMATCRFPFVHFRRLRQVVWPSRTISEYM